MASGLPILLLGSVKIAVGFYVFAAANSLLYAILLLVIVVQHRRENPNLNRVLRADLGTYQAVVTATSSTPATKSSAQPRCVTRPTDNP
jgi:hypothetical protein